MGQVYLAKTTGLGGFEREVVVKTLEVDGDADAAETDPFVTMFLDEAKLVGALHHQYIAPVFEVGRDDDGRYFLVMDYIQGATAEAVWKKSAEAGSPLSLEVALTIVRAVASALAYAHELRSADGSPLEIVHRDVSLSNIMVGYEGAVKLIDFGIAKSANRATRTQVGMLKGKFGYLAPEQVLRRPVDHRADIFALGVVLYELTTMARAFIASSELLTLERITKGDVKAPSKLVPSYPRGLELIVMKALAVDPDQRYQSARELATEVDAFARRIGVALGDAAVIDTMAELFDGSGRRRLARASGSVAKIDGAVVEAMPEQATIPISVVVEIDDAPELIEELELTTPVPVTAAQRPRTATAEVVFPDERRTGWGGFWVAIGLLAAAVGVAVVLGLT
jgi:eukaryotic-like serine/threonine-protein kinase